MNGPLKTAFLTSTATLLLYGLALGLKQSSAMPQVRQVLAGSNTNLVRAPEFPAGLSWFNTDKPLSIKGLRGKVVVLDFWTYGCINCLHIIPDLKFIEKKYAQQAVVIGVHSAKFETESDPKNLRQAVMRYGLEHPVVADKGNRIWNEYAVRAWPTLVVIDPDGRIAATYEGEGNGQALDSTIGSLVSQFRAAKKLNEAPLKVALERSKVATTPLLFPGKVTVANEKLFVADSSHNRLVISDAKTGKVEVVVGSGEAGLKDGSFSTAQFFNPQGIAVDGNTVYVADTNNHAIRVLNLEKKTVETLAGNGEQAGWGAEGGVGKAANLSSPWDIAKEGNTLYVAMAGPHQIWKVELPSARVSVFSGSGGEARRDGSRTTACFAQPSGLALSHSATGKEQLYVADSESSSLRTVSLETGAVKTLAGGDLFDFGDMDGKGLDVRLQHPLGLAWNRFDANDKGLYFCDTYNSKIKRANTETGEVTTIYAGNLDEPGGLAFLDAHTLVIADTNNSAIKKLDLKTKALSELKLTGLTAPRLQDATTSATRQDEQVLAPNATVRVIFNAKLPSGFHLNREAPLNLQVKSTGTALSVQTKQAKGTAFKLPTQFEFKSGAGGSGNLEVAAFISYCNEGKGAVCKVQNVKRTIPLQIREGGAKEVRIAIDLP